MTQAFVETHKRVSLAQVLRVASFDQIIRFVHHKHLCQPAKVFRLWQWVNQIRLIKPRKLHQPPRVFRSIRILLRPGLFPRPTSLAEAARLVVVAIEIPQRSAQSQARSTFWDRGYMKEARSSKLERRGREIGGFDKIASDGCEKYWKDCRNLSTVSDIQLRGKTWRSELNTNRPSRCKDHFSESI